MNHEFLELYPVNPSQLASHRETFSLGGAKDDQPDAELLCELQVLDLPWPKALNCYL
jgi:hypothetical protein